MSNDIVLDSLSLNEDIKLDETIIEDDIIISDTSTDDDILIEGLTVAEQSENDPTVPSHVKNITESEIDDWNSYREITNREVEEMFNG